MAGSIGLAPLATVAAHSQGEAQGLPTPAVAATPVKGGAADGVVWSDMAAWVAQTAPVEAGESMATEAILPQAQEAVWLPAMHVSSMEHSGALLPKQALALEDDAQPMWQAQPWAAAWGQPKAAVPAQAGAAANVASRPAPSAVLQASAPAASVVNMPGAVASVAGDVALMQEAPVAVELLESLSVPVATRMGHATGLGQTVAAAAPAHERMPLTGNAQQLVQALAQRIQVQQVQGAEIATVRLDPPQMGMLEIRIRQEAGAIQVQMQASHTDVGRQLGVVVEQLRQELQQRSPEVLVSVAQGRMGGGAGQGGRQGQQQEAPEAPVHQALQSWAESTLM